MNKFLWLSVLLMLVSNFIFADSLYQATSYESLVTDIKAKSVGDSVTVLIAENSDAKSKADTALKKDTNLGVSIKNNSNENSALVDLSMGHDGGGTTQRGGRLLAQITAVVTEIDANGRMHLKGEQNILINGEEQLISLDGWLRPTDIQGNNTILSTRLSDAKIEYKGYGLIDKSQKPGFFYWIFSKLGII